MGTVGYCEENGLSLEDIALIIRNREHPDINITPCDNCLMDLFNKMKKWSVEKRRWDNANIAMIVAGLSLFGDDDDDEGRPSVQELENGLRRAYGPDGRLRRSADDDTVTDEEDEDSDSSLEDEYSDESDY